MSADDKANTIEDFYEPTEPSVADSGLALITLIEELQKVDISSPLAKENALTISDNNGGRILL